MIKQILIIAIILSTVACEVTKPLMSKTELKKDGYQEVKGFFDEKNASTGKPDVYPMYPGGINGLLKSAGSLVQYPDEAVKNKEHGTVIVKYVIDVDGSLRDVKVVKSVSKSLDNESLRVIKSLNSWYPGFKNGKPTKVEFKQPFEF